MSLCKQIDKFTLIFYSKATHLSFAPKYVIKPEKKSDNTVLKYEETTEIHCQKRGCRTKAALLEEKKTTGR
ncbi:MAG: hypothetical protein ACI4SB_09965, partial [Acutalibacteraceae bacterium]